jgi:UDP-glucose 4-epimerase
MFFTGGAGYIGSPCLVELLEAGFMVISYDNLLSTILNEKKTLFSFNSVLRRYSSRNSSFKFSNS